MKWTLLTAVITATALQLIADEKSPCTNLRYDVNASFTYWFAKEDGLNLAQSAQVNAAATTVLASSPAVLKQEFGYHPGFTLGAGIFSATDWKVSAEYTYYRGKNRVSQNAPTGTTGTGVWNLNSWYLQETFFSHQSLTGTALSSSWKIGMDMIDLVLSYPLSRKAGLVCAPFGGLRTVWLRQQLNLNLNVAGASFGGDSFLGSQPVSSKNSSHAWGIGPRVGAMAQYNLPMGFNLDGTIGTSLLYNHFHVQHTEGAAVTYYETPQRVQISYNCVRPELDVSLGFGWGRDFCDKQHLSLEASYDFTYFWGQNMMRSLMDEYVAGTSAGSLDLYFFGLTLRAGYEF